MGGAGVEHVERESAAAEDLVVEGADVEFGAELFLRALAELEDLELAELVGAGLRGPRDVAVGLGLDERLVDVVLAHVVDDLIAGPALRVDAGVDDEADGAEELGVEAAVVADGVLIEADFFAELLGVERPAFGVGAEAGVEAELGQALELLLDGELHVMAGDAFVVGDGFVDRAGCGGRSRWWRRRRGRDVCRRGCRSGSGWSRRTGRRGWLRP